MVHRAPRAADRRAGGGLGADPGRPRHAHRGADGIRQDARRVSFGPRCADPPGHGPAGPDAPPLRFSAARPLERRPEEPPVAAVGDPRARRFRSGRAGARAHRRYDGGRAGRDDASAAAHPGHDPGVALHPPRKRGRAGDAAFGRRRHRGRDPRGRAGQAGQPPRPLARTSRCADGPAGAADRPVGDAEAPGRGGPLPGGSGSGMRARGRGDVPGARPRRRDPAVAALGGVLARTVGGDLHPHGRARARAPNDARLREHAQDGRAHRRAARRNSSAKKP